MLKRSDSAAAGEPTRYEPQGQGATYAIAISLAALAGFVDAAGYMHFKHLFVSFMSGNSTQAMVAAATSDLPKFILFGRTILLFVAGATLGELVGTLSQRWGRSLVLLVEVFLLGTALGALGLGWAEGWVAGALATAMGVQNAAVHKAEGISVSLTYVTGTLIHISRSIAAALRGAGPWNAALPFAGLWFGLMTGGFAGAVVASGSLEQALVIAIGAGVILSTWAAITAAIIPDIETR